MWSPLLDRETLGPLLRMPFARVHKRSDTDWLKRKSLVDQLTQSSNTPRDSNTLYAWLREVAELREAA